MQRDAGRISFNLALDPSLPGSCGVVALSVQPGHAGACAAFLSQHWRDGGLQIDSPHGDDGDKTNREHLCVLRKVLGYSTYPKTLEEHSAEEQRTNTLLITNTTLSAFRVCCPGFASIEAELVDWLANQDGEPCELFFAHALRQSPDTLRSTGFGPHQDTEDFSFIKHSLIVKLTPDESGESPSAMRVQGAGRDFEYGPQAGAAGCFLAELFHQSLAPRSAREHMKIEPVAMLKSARILSAPHTRVL